MRKAFLMLGLLSMAALASCSIEDELQTEVQSRKVRATLEQTVPEASTRAFAEYNTEKNKYYISWNEEDRISVFSETTLNQEYVFDGFDGSPSGTFSPTETAGSSGGDAITTEYQYAIYPYDETNNSCATSGSLTVAIPKEQTAHDGEMSGIGARMIMVARDNTGDFSFKHIGCYIGVTLKGEGVSVASISFQGNNAETLAGVVTVTFDDNGEPVTVFENNYASSQSQVITMNFETPVSLNSEEEKEFWLALPAITLSKGYTMTVTDNRGGKFEKKTTSSLTLKRKNFYHCPADVVTTIPVSSITLNKSELALNVNATETLVATVEPEDADFETISWSSSAPTIAKVDDNGKVTAVKAGEAVITATAGDKSATCAVTVSDDVTYALTITPATASIDYNETQTYVVNLITTTNGSAGEPQAVSATLTSSDPTIATVSGLVATGKKGGTVEISASYKVDENTTVTTTTPASLTVEDVVSYELTITPATASIDYNETQTYVVNLITTTNGTAGTPQAVSATLTSSDPTIATVSGLVATGKKGGTVEISASYKVDENTTVTTTTPASLTVEDVVSYELTITPATATINYNETQTYVVNLITTTNGTAGTPQAVSATLTSSDPTIATVSGLVATGKKGGTVEISASYKVDENTTVTTTTPASLTVEDVVSYALSIEPAEEAKVIIGKELQFTAYLTTTTNGVEGEPTELTSGVTWSSSDSFAEIDNTGTATGKAEGEVTITAKYTPSGSTELTATVTLTVTKDPNHAGDPIPIGEGENL